MSTRQTLLYGGLLMALGAATAVQGQWSSDPASNLVIVDRPGEQVQAKIAPTADGGCYISWLDNSTGGYDVYLQRLSAAGVAQWADGGILVADRSFSSTQDYGLAVDTAGNALLTFRDDSGANPLGDDIQIAAAKVATDGTLLWGGGGVQVTSTPDFVAAPKIAGTSDGQVVVAWTQGADVKALKLDGDGSPAWGSAVTLTSSGGTSALSDLQAADGGSAIVSFIRSGSSVGPRHILAQKLASADGASLWAADHVKVYDNPSGSLQFGNFPSFLYDGAGGAVFAWYTSSPSLQCRAQRILANGTEAFAHNGVEVSTDGSRSRVNPSAAWSSSAEEIFVFWTELNSQQSQFGLYGQKLDVSGARQWGAEGREILPVTPLEISQVRALPWDDGAVVAWAESIAFGNQPLSASRLDAAGDFVWTPTAVDLATSATSTSRLAAASSAAGFAIFAWSDDDGAGDDILAQNLQPDGTLGGAGNVGLFSDGFEGGDTMAWSSSAP